MSALQVLLSRKANGVLPVPTAAATTTSARASAATETAKSAKSKAATEGDKVIVRRLPPGLTEDEFLSILGDEWKPGKKKVGWFSYHPGKVSRDPSKTSRPSFASIQVLHREDLGALSEAVRSAAWIDAKDTWQSASTSLAGPPVAEYSLYKKIPSGKRRSDGRQGTIDQDAEFMAFLEALANPASAGAKDGSGPGAANGSGADGDGAGGDDDAGKSKTKTTSTPLIDYLREKKANKSKEAAGGKSGKQGRDKGKASAQDDTASGKRNAKGGKGGDRDKADKADRADRDKERSSGRSKGSVKILTKKAIAEAAEAARVAASNLNATPTSTSTAAAASTGASTTGAREEMPKSRRAGILAAARILQRDLGLSPGLAHRKARAAAQAAQATDSQAADSEPKAAGKAKERDVGSHSSTGGASEAPTKPATIPTGPSTSSGPDRSRAASQGAGSASGAASARGARGKKGVQASPGEVTSGNSRGRGGGGGGGAATEKNDSTPVAPTKILLKKKDDNAAAAAASLPVAPPTGPRASLQDKTERAERQERHDKPERQARAAPGKKGVVAAAAAPASVASASTAAAVTPGTVRGFVKHANASQGVTEARLREAMAGFGAVTLVEMDRRKGFAFVDFAEHSSLVRAMEASPVAVGQAAVQVLERKDREKKAGGASVGGAAGGSAGRDKEAGAAASAASAGRDKDKENTARPKPKAADKDKAADKADKDKADKTADGKRSVRRRGGRRRGGGDGDGDDGPGHGKEKESKEGGRHAVAADGGAAPTAG